MNSKDITAQDLYNVCELVKQAAENKSDNEDFSTKKVVGTTADYGAGGTALGYGVGRLTKTNPEAALYGLLIEAQVGGSKEKYRAYKYLNPDKNFGNYFADSFKHPFTNYIELADKKQKEKTASEYTEDSIDPNNNIGKWMGAFAGQHVAGSPVANYYKKKALHSADTLKTLKNGLYATTAASLAGGVAGWHAGDYLQEKIKEKTATLLPSGVVDYSNLPKGMIGSSIVSNKRPSLPLGAKDEKPAKVTLWGAKSEETKRLRNPILEALMASVKY